MHRAAVALSLAAVIMAQGLHPWHFLAYPHAFSWIPFHSSMSGSIEVNYVVFLEKCFWYTALVWLLTCVRIGMRAATVTAVLLLLVIEIGQMWLPDRSAEITDPLLALLAGILIAHLGPSVDRGPRRLECDARNRGGAGAMSLSPAVAVLGESIIADQPYAITGDMKGVGGGKRRADCVNRRQSPSPDQKCPWDEA